MEHCPYWCNDDFVALEESQSFRAVGAVFYRVLLRMVRSGAGPIYQVCGPITTGGLGSTELNYALMRRAVAHLREEGYTVLDQTPLRPHVERLYRRWREMFPHAPYCYEILDEIYAPTIDSGYVEVYHFIPKWNESTGSVWEFRRVHRLGRKAQDFPAQAYERIVAELLPV